MPRPGDVVSGLRRPQVADRELAMLHTARQHRHVTARQFHALHFHGTTRVPCDGVLRRLVKHGYLTRTKKYAPVAGGGFYVYRLTRLGHDRISDDKYTPARSHDMHNMAVGECVVSLRQLERAGSLRIIGMDFEPDCHTVIGGEHLKPDLYVWFEHARHGDVRLWIEADLATEGMARIQSKLWLYIRAWQKHLDDYAAMQRWPEFPRILWVAVDAERERQLLAYVEMLPENESKLFRVTTFEQLPVILS